MIRTNLHSARWLLFSFFFLSCQHDQGSLKQTKLLANYPSGSGLAYLNGRLYVMGDDATRMLVLDANLNIIDSLSIVDTSILRLPKKIKNDLEAIAVVGYRESSSLLLIGSGSLQPYRNSCVLVSPRLKTKQFYDLSSFYKRLQSGSIKEINIEGAATVPGGLVLASRGNKKYRWNHLIFTDASFFKHPDSAQVRTVRVGANSDTIVFRGVSGVEYAQGSDKLLLTVSTENTYSSFSDGAIGKSYLWIINDITNRKRISHINPDKIIDLEEIDDRFKGHKIESVCILKETRRHLLLVLAADDDKGQTLLFRMQIRK